MIEIPIDIDTSKITQALQNIRGSVERLSNRKPEDNMKYLESIDEAIIRAASVLDMEETEKRFEKYVENAVFIAFREHTDLRLRPLEKLTTGLVGLVLATVLTAVLALVVRGAL